ncbi:RagB/SusD family nutrient uptake outer membrane protein [Sphingobacterium sp. Mn56C]
MRYTFFSVCLIWLCMGCNGFLDEVPTAQQATVNYYKTAEDAVRGVTAAYRLMKDQAYAGYSPSSFGDVRSDDAHKGGGGASDQALLQQLKLFTAGPENGYVFNAWRDNFRGVFLANTILQKVPPIAMDAKLKTRVLAEAYFLRAYYYFQLVRLFERVPLLLEPLENGKYDVPQSEATVVLAQVEADLQIAMQGLESKAQQQKENYGRATEGAARALLLELYMWQHRWVDAQQIGDEIMQSKAYSLVNDVTEIWTIAGEFGSESIFEVNCENIPGKGTGNLLNLFMNPRNTWGYGFIVPSKSLVAAFEPGDPRLTATVIQHGQLLPDGTIANTAASETGYWNRKYWLPKDQIPTATGGTNADGPTNDRIFGLAQVMLWTAEAAYHNGNISYATSLVNRIRERARKHSGNTDMTILPAYARVTLAQIYQEMRVETALGEHRRFYELVRTGRAAAVLPNFKKGIHERLPIPLSEIQLSAGLLKQNIGY